MARKTQYPERASAHRRRRGRGRWALSGLRWLVGRLLAPAVLAALVGAGYWALGELESFRVRQVAVRNNAKAAAEEILALSGLQAGSNVFRIDTGEIAHAVEEHPWVARAAVYRRFPSTVVIEVSEEVPLLVANVEAGMKGTASLYLVNADGKLFKRATPAEAAGHPVLSGLGPEALKGVSGAGLAGVRNALAVLALAARGGHPTPQEIAEIAVAGQGGELTLLTSRAGETGAEIRLGAPPYPTKWERLQRIWADLKVRGVRAARVEFLTGAKVVVVPASALQAKI